MVEVIASVVGFSAGAAFFARHRLQQAARGREEREIDRMTAKWQLAVDAYNDVRKQLETERRKNIETVKAAHDFEVFQAMKAMHRRATR